MRRILVLCALSLSIAVAACEPASPIAPASPTAAPAEKRPGEATVGDITTCPVTKQKFMVLADSAKTTYDGKTYYFCCSECPARFLQDPKKYTSQ